MASTAFTHSAQQIAIFQNFGQGLGHLMVRARAGTGKTTTIVAGLAHIPAGEKVLLAAFNKSIAEELSARIASLPVAAQVEAKTLHSLGFAFLRQNWAGVRVDNFRGENLARKACGSREPDSVVREVAKLASLAKGAHPEASTEGLMDLCFAHNLGGENASSGYLNDLVSWAQQAMALALIKDGSIDFDDMVFVPLQNGWIRPWYSIVIIDEAQDMNASQILMALKACKKGGRIIVVGDDMQAIYGFRGADSGSLDRLKIELRAQELGLTTTYRCGKAIVALAQTLVPDFHAGDMNPEGEILDKQYQECLTSVLPGDFVLSRKNAPLVPACLALLRKGVRAMVKGRDIGAGLISLVDKLCGKRNSIPEFLAKLEAWERKQIARLEAAGGKQKEARIGEVQDKAETLREIAQDMVSIGEYKARITSLFQDPTPGDLRDKVILSSVHKAKGLEANRVWLFAETLYPGGRQTQEERNIHYVAVTRAKQVLLSVTGVPTA